LPEVNGERGRVPAGDDFKLIYGRVSWALKTRVSAIDKGETQGTLHARQGSGERPKQIHSFQTDPIRKQRSTCAPGEAKK